MNYINPWDCGSGAGMAVKMECNHPVCSRPVNSHLLKPSILPIYFILSGPFGKSNGLSFISAQIEIILNSEWKILQNIHIVDCRWANRMCNLYFGNNSSRTVAQVHEVRRMSISSKLWKKKMCLFFEKDSNRNICWKHGPTSCSSVCEDNKVQLHPM